MSVSSLDGRNDKPVVLDERLLNCPDSADGLHAPFRSRDGQRCAECGAWIRQSLSRPIIDERAPITPATMDYLRRRLPENLVAMQHARNQVENMMREQFWMDIGRPADAGPAPVGLSEAEDYDLIRLGSDFQ